MTPHDFEFHFGRNRILRGRGWRGLMALGLVVTAAALISSNIGTSIVSPMTEELLHLISAHKITN